AEFGTCVGEKRNRHLEQFCWKSPRIDAGSAVPTSSHFGAADRNAQNLIADEAVEMSDDRPQRPKAKTGSAIDRFDPRLADQSVSLWALRFDPVSQKHPDRAALVPGQEVLRAFDPRVV